MRLRKHILGRVLLALLMAALWVIPLAAAPARIASGEKSIDVCCKSQPAPAPPQDDQRRESSNNDCCPAGATCCGGQGPLVAPPVLCGVVQLPRTAAEYRDPLLHVRHLPLDPILDPPRA